MKEKLRKRSDEIEASMHSDALIVTVLRNDKPVKKKHYY